MRRLKAILVVISLLVAPMALFADAWTCACAAPYCTMAECRTQCPMMQQHQCQGSGLALSCNCMRYPALAALIPLTQMILPAAVPRPMTQRGAPRLSLATLLAPAGVKPSPFHPPRG